MSSIIGNTITALRNQLENYSGLTYAKDSGYENMDILDLIQTNKFPFYNIVSIGKDVSPTNNIKIDHFERHTISIVIQVAVRSLKLKRALEGYNTTKGLYEFVENIWDGIKSDRTLGGVVNGLLPASNVEMDVIEVPDEKERYFIGAGEIRLQFYKDEGLL